MDFTCPVRRKLAFMTRLYPSFHTGLLRRKQLSAFLLLHCTKLIQPDIPPPAVAALNMTVPDLIQSCLLAGDLLTALLLAWLHKHPGNLKLAVELAIAGLQAVLGRTIEAAGDAVTATELSSEVYCL